MGYLSSQNVDVFPCVGRTVADKRSARLVSERMLTSLVNNLLDKDSFVIDASLDSSENKVQFNLYGYFFSVTLGSDSDINGLVGDNSTKVYASITLVNTDTFAQINGQDSDESGDGQYTGLDISGIEPTSSSAGGGELHYILLLERKDPSKEWYVPQDSYVKYIIDGGVLD